MNSKFIKKDLILVTDENVLIRYKFGVEFHMFSFDVIQYTCVCDFMNSLRFVFAEICVFEAMTSATSALYVLDIKGRCLISRDYRGDVTTAQAEKFFSKLLEKEVFPAYRKFNRRSNFQFVDFITFSCLKFGGFFYFFSIYFDNFLKLDVCIIVEFYICI